MGVLGGRGEGVGDVFITQIRYNEKRDRTITHQVLDEAFHLLNAHESFLLALSN